MISLGDRMKGYESVSKTKLVKRMPVAVRIDGKAFHTFTKGFNKPFDDIVSDSMARTMRYLCRGVQNCVLGYTQSDEITLILCDYKTLETSPYFDNEVQKLCSVIASMATMKFNQIFTGKIEDDWYTRRDDARAASYKVASDKGAMFDARVFNIPKEEVTNLLIWRQQDAIRNSIEALGRVYFSDKELFKKNCDEIKEMISTGTDMCWDDLETKYKRGFCCMKDDNRTTDWVLDYEIPVFTENRDYIESKILI